MRGCQGRDQRKIEASGEDNVDVVSGGDIFVIAAVATLAALYSIGM
jgi:hypothetical protein